MEVDLLKPVSGRQFAKMVGVSSDNAVRKAVERGSILKGYIKSEKMFIPKIAADEWGKDILPEYGGPKRRNVPRMENKPPPPKPKAEKKVTADDVVKEVLAEAVPKKKQTTNQIIGFFDDDEDEPEDEEHPEGWVSKPEAERRTAIHKSEILEIALAEKKKELLPRDKVEKVLFGYGQEIRTTFTGLPAKIIDKIRACNERHEALRVLDDAVHEALNLLTDVENREI